MEQKWCNYDKHWVPLSDFSWLPRLNKPHSECKPCNVKRQQAYYLRNREKYLAYRREYRLKNRDHILVRDRQSMARRKLVVLAHYGNGLAACVCCGVSEVEFLTLDHIAADGADHRKRLKKESGVGGHATGWFIYKWLIDNGFPEGYQTLCFNCNVGKHRSKVNRCPHELRRQELMAITISAAQQAA